MLTVWHGILLFMTKLWGIELLYKDMNKINYSQTCVKQPPNGSTKIEQVAAQQRWILVQN